MATIKHPKPKAHFNKIAEELDYNNKDDAAGGELRESSMICAPLVTRDGLMGVLKVASCDRDGLGSYEVKFVERLAHAGPSTLRGCRPRTQSDLPKIENSHTI